MTPRLPLSPLILPPHPGSAPSSAVDNLEPQTILRPTARRHSQPLSPSPTPMRAPSPIRRPSHPSPDGRNRLDMRSLHDALSSNASNESEHSERPCRAGAPPSLPHTPRSRSQPPFGDYGRRGSLPLATPRHEPKPPEVGDNAPTTIRLDTLRAMAASGADFTHFPTVAFNPTGGGGKHTVIHRTVPGGLFGPDVAARLVAHLAAEPLLSPWLSPRTSPSLLPLAFPDETPTTPTGTHSRSNSISGIPKTPISQIQPLPLPTAAPRRMPEAWWAGAPSVRAAAWAALLDDDVDMSSNSITWVPGGFGIARGASSSHRNSMDWSVLCDDNTSTRGMHTFEFLPPFGEDESDTLRSLLASRSPSRSGRSAAPSPETIAPVPASPAVSDLSLEPRPVSPSPLPKLDHTPGAKAKPVSVPAPRLPTQAQAQSQRHSYTQTQTQTQTPIPGPASAPTHGRRNTLSLFGLSPRKARK
ncbi:hypothetical protein CspeluHIS016_0901370 [Cutaneotrichosporon spelunceum]|uniref:Uncharacterized protein n=1 Tax=Cutaneotrichosporon spelunceum TaxID=1672016 RepID=A0AAD3U0E5_9TREE|nr:hypothetical protein CspeluHIS016_0901370 [Cutaneotrichosporon spelunceum]